MKFSIKTAVVLGLSTGMSAIAALGFQSPAQAGWEVPGTDLCVGFGCDGESILVPDAGMGLDSWIVDRWNEIGEGPESVARLCGEVGLTTCSDPNFISIYQTLRVGAWGHVYDNVNACVGTGYSISETGSTAGQLIGAAYGVAIPNELMDLVSEQNFDHIVAACEELYPGQYNVNNLTEVNDGRGNSIFVPVEDETRVSRNIRPGGNNRGTSGNSSGSRLILQETGRLTVDDHRFNDNTPYDTYQFSGRAGQSITISLSSQEFDTYLVLADSNHETIAENDDSSGTDAEIVMTLPSTGTYYVHANSYTTGSYGNYELTVR